MAEILHYIKIFNTSQEAVFRFSKDFKPMLTGFATT